MRTERNGRRKEQKGEGRGELRSELQGKIVVEMDERADRQRITRNKRTRG